MPSALCSPNKLLFIFENLIISFTFSVEPVQGIVFATLTPTEFTMSAKLPLCPVDTFHYCAYSLTPLPPVC